MRKWILIAALAGISPVAMAQAAPAAPAVAASTDMAATGPGGSTFILPAGWRADTAGKVLTLSPPEPDFRLVIVDVGAAADAKAAAAAAWAAYAPARVHSFKLLTTRPPRNGWDETGVIDYETSPGEHLAQTAIARRRGTAWTVLIIDGSEATFEKRAGAVGQIVPSLRPAGYARESFAGKTANPLDAARVQGLLDFVKRNADAMHIPGVGLAFYAGGKIVYEGGVGVKEIGKPDPVGPHTRFMIASNTKSMATLLLAELVSEGRLRWDQPVTEVYPAFRLGSDATTKSVQIRHLVCACTGLPRKDLEWIFTTTAQTPASDTFRQLALTEPTSKFGEAFQYNNLMASAAGYIAGHIYYPDMELGAAFDWAVKEHVWQPLGMADSTMTMDEALAADHASPHGDDLSGKTAIEPQDLNRTIAPFRPAGGAWSSPHDMILYMKNELDEGALPKGGRLLSAEALLARRARGVPVAEDHWYGMGLMEDASAGVSVIHHGGDLMGYHSEMFAIPSAGVAAVILTNGENGPYLRRVFQRRLLEVLYDGQPEAQGDADAIVKRIAAELAEYRSKIQLPADAKVIGALAAKYVSPDLGTLRLVPEKGQVRGFTQAWNSLMTTRRNQDGTVSLVSIDPGWIGDGGDMVLGVADGKRTLTVRDGQHVYVFTEGS
ncbi:MAG: serine hydrolase domain-containing protein [Novosphingobium sp.]|uniref:serine hydrolase domain-containing protein n=1 Tax=Novosphingobium sp. TaxID=1874826 RepID=UPI003015B9C8